MQILIIYKNKIGMELYKTGEEALCTGRLTRLICISSSLHLINHFQLKGFHVLKNFDFFGVTIWFQYYKEIT
jgi:hypothetical protein